MFNRFHAKEPLTWHDLKGKNEWVICLKGGGVGAHDNHFYYLIKFHLQISFLFRTIPLNYYPTPTRETFPIQEKLK